MQKLKNKFISKIKKTKKCWLWIGNKDKDGYGRFCLNHKKEIRAHRFSYQIFVSNIPKGMFVCHTCDNPSCVKPEHLFIGTVLDNHQDMDKKKRRVIVTGEKHGMSKLKESEVREIRRLYKIIKKLNIKISHETIGKIYEVSRRTIGNIINNKNWK